MSKSPTQWSNNINDDDIQGAFLARPPRTASPPARVPARPVMLALLESILYE